MIKTQIVEYRDGDTVCEGYLAYDDAKSGKRRQERLKAVRCAAEPVEHDDRRAFAFGFHHHPRQADGGHAERSTILFSSTPMPPISMRTTSPFFR